MKLFYVLTWTILSHTAFSWDTDDLELFDLVEDVNKNFYDVLGVPSVSNLLSITAICQRDYKHHHPYSQSKDRTCIYVPGLSFQFSAHSASTILD